MASFATGSYDLGLTTWLGRLPMGGKMPSCPTTFGRSQVFRLTQLAGGPFCILTSDFPIPKELAFDVQYRGLTWPSV